MGCAGGASWGTAGGFGGDMAGCGVRADGGAHGWLGPRGRLGVRQRFNCTISAPSRRPRLGGSVRGWLAPRRPAPRWCARPATPARLGPEGGPVVRGVGGLAHAHTIRMRAAADPSKTGRGTRCLCRGAAQKTNADEPQGRSASGCRAPNLNALRHRCPIGRDQGGITGHQGPVAWNRSKSCLGNSCQDTLG